jgi:tRNA-Thr(GGU) m(6)t(6)A37 methyltransferase TsaA
MRVFCLWPDKYSDGQESRHPFITGALMHLYMNNQDASPAPAILKPIGIIHSPYRKRGDAPRQGRLSEKESVIEIYPEYHDGLDGIEDHRHLIALYWFDRSDRSLLKATPPGSGTEHGVFATRSPERPNPIGFAVIDLVHRDRERMVVRGLDAFDGTPILDLKPYYPDLDCVMD